MKQRHHTPGPWEATADGMNVRAPRVAPRFAVARVVTEVGTAAIAAQTRCADARLIAAAPKMLTALDLILFAVTDDADTNDGRVDRAAIAALARSAIKEATTSDEPKR